MPKSSEPKQNEFSDLVKNAREAMTTLTQGLEQENKVFLSFCDSLVGSTLNAMTQLSKLDINIAKEGASTRQALAEAKKAALVAADEKGKAAAKTAAAPAAVEAAPNAKQPTDSQGLAEAFVNGVSISMMNAVSAQQQLYTLAQAATTQTIASIISITEATLAIAVRNIESK